MAAATAQTTFSEDQYGKKVDRCVTDTLVKAGNLCFLFNSIIQNIAMCYFNKIMAILCKSWHDMRWHQQI